MRWTASFSPQLQLGLRGHICCTNSHRTNRGHSRQGRQKRKRKERERGYPHSTCRPGHIASLQLGLELCQRLGAWKLCPFLSFGVFPEPLSKPRSKSSAGPGKYTRLSSKKFSPGIVPVREILSPSLALTLPRPTKEEQEGAPVLSTGVSQASLSPVKVEMAHRGCSCSYL